jgi:hypothetical protein
LLRAVLVAATGESRPAPFLHAQTSAVSFYQRLGFTAVGDEFEEAGITHRKMKLEESAGDGEPDLANRALGQTAGAFELRGANEIRLIGNRMAAQARRELLLFSRDLDAELYNNREFLEAIRNIALHGRGTPVRILLFHAEPAIRKRHRLVEAARHMTSKIQIQRIPADFARHTEAFLLADDHGYLLRRLADVFDATADFDDPRTVRQLRERFDEIWSMGEIHQELRRLNL